VPCRSAAVPALAPTPCSPATTVTSPELRHRSRAAGAPRAARALAPPRALSLPRALTSGDLALRHENPNPSHPVRFAETIREFFVSAIVSVFAIVSISAR
jgi:hypothetical protein